MKQITNILQQIFLFELHFLKPKIKNFISHYKTKTGTKNTIYTILIASFLFISCLFTSAEAIAQIPNEIQISNGVIKLKLDLTSGGAISYLSTANSNYNVVNIHDKGRYVQQSYYAGQHINRRSEGQHPEYSPWNWNPIQAGDIYGNRSQVVDYRQTSTQLYVKNRPYLWDMNKELCQCFFETWVTLDRNSAHVRNKLTVFRTDNRWDTRPYHQELPAVYTRGDLYKLYTYRGSAPWTNGSLSTISNDYYKTPPDWKYWTTKESWAALVNSNNWGVGVYNPISTYFIGGFHGSPGGGPNNGPTGYFSPLITKALKKNDVLQYEYDLILGNLNDIRSFVYQKKGVNPGGGGNTLAWNFNQSGNKEGWTRGGGTRSIAATGRELKVTVGGADPQIIRRNISINPRSYTHLRVGMKNYTNDNYMEVFWSNSSGGFSGSKRIRVSVVPNSGSQREYVFDLRNTSLWTNGGTVNAIRIDPPGNGSPTGEHVRIDYIRLTGSSRSSKQINSGIFSHSNKGDALFPNPFTNRLNIQTTKDQFTLYNIKGQKFKVPYSKTNDGLDLNTEALSSGMYYIKVGDEIHQVYKSSKR